VEPPAAHGRSTTAAPTASPLAFTAVGAKRASWTGMPTSSANTSIRWFLGRFVRPARKTASISNTLPTNTENTNPAREAEFILYRKALPVNLAPTRFGPVEHHGSQWRLDHGRWKCQKTADRQVLPR